jgi:phosphoribosylformylglycinamidine synthase subunit PurL
MASRDVAPHHGPSSPLLGTPVPVLYARGAQAGAAGARPSARWGNVTLHAATVDVFPDDERLDEERARPLARELGLTDDELDRIVETLGRMPSVSELGMYSVMWSEHCSYKSSRMHLRGLPTTGPQVLVGPGENAGVVDVGDGLAVTFKIESHNHPSAVEPVQGAATGVGGILRDILTMGARPIAVMDALRFGDPGGWTALDGTTVPVDARQRHLVDGVVRGVGLYGNCVGVPNIGGETVFDPDYAENPLVNALAVGLLRHEDLQLARAERAGDLAVLLGSATGRDGIGGASVLASATFEDDGEDRRPNVQIGDPFAEKLLIECCLELYHGGLVSGIQDMGAAGIACATSELSSAASMGMRVDLDRVHLRDDTMASWEILCSESQERMLALVRPDRLDEVLAVAARWQVPASVIGEVVEGSTLTLTAPRRRRRRAARAQPRRRGPGARPSARAPRPHGRARRRRRGGRRPARRGARLAGGDVATLLLRALGSPMLASKRWVHEQYDHLVLGGTVLPPGAAGAGVVRLEGTERAVALSTVGNGRWCELDPREGTRRAVAAAYRDVACTGARPLATTNCLNMGDPTRPDQMWQLVEVIGGLGDACVALDVPVTGGNVSLYNATRGRPIPPTPVIGIIGVLDRASDAVARSVRADGDELWLIGAPTTRGLAGSELVRLLGREPGGVLAPVDPDLERRLAGVLGALAREGALRSAGSIGRGGLVAALVRACVGGGRGARITLPDVDGAPATRDGRQLAQALFSEAPGRVLVSVALADATTLAARCEAAGVTAARLGVVGGDAITLDGVADLPLDVVTRVHRDTLHAALGELDTDGAGE